MGLSDPASSGASSISIKKGFFGFAMLKQTAWCALCYDAKMMDNLPDINDGGDEDGEAERPHQGLILFQIHLFVDYLFRTCFLPLKRTVW